MHCEIQSACAADFSVPVHSSYVGKLERLVRCESLLPIFRSWNACCY